MTIFVQNKKIIKLRGLFLFLIVCFITPSFGQDVPEQDSTSGGRTGIVRNLKTDTIYPDTVIYSWKYSPNSFVKLFAQLDTSLLAIQYPEEYKRNYIGYVYLGNLGTAARTNSFYERRKNPVHWQIQNFYPYLMNHDKQMYFNTKIPFTRMQYGSAAKKWEYFGFIHTQNINEEVNVGISYEIYSSDGYLIEQETRNRNFSYWTDLDFDRYKAYYSLHFNGINVDENGGIISDELLIDTAVDISELNTRLHGANNTFSYFNTALDHQVAIARWGGDTIKPYRFSLEHHASVDRYKHLYIDQNELYYNPIADTSFAFYKNYYNGTGSYDTISVLDVKNRIALSFSRNKKSGFYFGPFLEHHILKYTNLFRDTLFSYYNDKDFQTYAAGANMGFHKKNDFAFDIQGQYGILDKYNYQDYEIKSNLVKWLPMKKDTAYFHLEAEHKKKTPDYFEQRYYSNHFKWVNDFHDIFEQQVILSSKLINTNLSLSLSFNQVENLIYFDTTMNIRQYPDALQVFGAKLNKLFMIGQYLFFDINMLGQYTSSNIIDIPELTVNSTIYYKREINFKKTGGKLLFNIGITAKSHSKYYVPAYNPATAQFYQQRNKLIGNYPEFDFFVSGRIKSFIAFIRVEHANDGALNQTSYAAYNYPIRPRNVKFGFSWNFVK